MREVSIKTATSIDMIEVIFGIDLVWARSESIVDDISTGSFGRNPETELIALDVVGHGAVWEIDSCQVVEIAVLAEKDRLV